MTRSWTVPEIPYLECFRAVGFVHEYPRHSHSTWAIGVVDHDVGGIWYRGIAMVECFGTIVAHVAEVEVTEDGAVQLRRFTTAADCGMAVNPDGFRAQMESGIIFGLSAALFGEITIDHGAVVQQNFPDYQVVHLDECPEIDVHIVEGDGPLGGAGEPPVPPGAPALTNAIFAATGVRIRELPVMNHSLAKSARASTQQ